MHDYSKDPLVPYAQLWARDVDAELRINDIPVATAGVGALVTQATPIRNLLLRGRNLMTLDLRSATVPAEGRGGWSDQAIAQARVADYAAGQVMDANAGQQRTAFQVPFSPEQQNPVSQTSEFTSEIGEGWAWSVAPPIDPAQPNVRSALDRFMTGVHDAFVRRDMSGLAPLHAPSARDFARAYPVHSAEDVLAQIATLFDPFSAATWEVVPLDLSRAVYRPLAGGRLVQALDQEGRPLVRSVDYPPSSGSEKPRVCAFSGLIGVHENRLQVLY